MAVARVNLARVEGGAALVQDEQGVVRLQGGRPLGLEDGLIGRTPLEAVYLTQQISADSGVTHGLAAVLAAEDAGQLPVAHNGLLLRDLMHTLSLLHAHLRHFYFRVLPDYLPSGAWETYGGALSEIKAIARGFGRKGANSWGRFKRSHPFEKKQVVRLIEHQARAVAALSRLQRMIAAVGGKFPMVMSLVPGGVSVPVDEGLVLKLRDYLREIGGFLGEGPLEDGLTVVQSFPELKTLGVGGEDFLCAGTLGDETGPDASLIPKGVWLEKALETLQPQVSESIHRSFYRVPLSKPRRGNVVELAPGKAGAYSWIKSPRYLGNAMEVGPVARLVITGMAGSRSHTAQVAELLKKRLGLSLAQANSAGGRILATLGELGPLFRWCEKILDDLKPGEPSAAPGAAGAVTGQGLGAVEGPAGAVMHHVVVERGRITHYDIISPSTWNGGPRDLDNQPSGVELALSRKPPRLSTAKGRLAASRIVHSFYFSARDAVH